MTANGGAGGLTRQRALRAHRVVETPPEADFDELAALAAQTCGLPAAAIVFLDEMDRCWLKAIRGEFDSTAALDPTLFNLVGVAGGEVVMIPDAAADPHPFARRLASSTRPVQCIAAVALRAPEGPVIGCLAVMGPEPRAFDAAAREALRATARQVENLLELRRTASLLRDEVEHRERAEAGLRHQNEKLLESQKEASRLLELAEKSRGALLSILEDEQRTGKALTRSNRALKMLSTCNEALIWAKDEATLLTEVCRIAVEQGGHSMAFVAYVEEGPGRVLSPKGQWGDTTGYLDEISLTWDDATPAGRGPAGRCVRESQAMACHDIRAAEWSGHDIEATERRGYRSVICLPLRDAERTFGILGLYSGETRNPEEGEVRLLQELADDISLGINALRSRTVREQAEKALLGSLREKEALLKEVHHRVKNNLQVIASLLRLESRRIAHPITQQVLGEMQNRIQSMALLHETLYRSGNFATVDLAAYLTQLTRQMFRSLARQSDVALELDLAPASLEIDQAIPCGLIVNELASNSLKHGFPPGRRGVVTVRMVRAENGRLTITVSDDGVGLPQGFEAGATGSLGLQLVTDLSRQLQGALTIGPGPQAVFEVSFTPSGSANAHPPPPASVPTTAATGSSS